MISLKLTPAAEKFRADFGAWLEANPPPAVSGAIELDKFVEISRLWQRKLAEGRWIGLHWPETFGGRGLTLVEEAVSQELLARAHSPQLINLFGLTMAGPVILKHGTESQKQKFLRKILSAEEIWCQGFSEPGAGSDLASLKTTADRISTTERSSWRITGQKVWTGFAQYADWCFMLVRTDQSVRQHKGLSYFLVPMKSAGVRVRPLEQITGECEFNEVFLDQVEVGDELMVGVPGQGWEIAISTLMYERAILTFGRFLQSDEVLGRIAAHLRKHGASPLEKLRFGELQSRSMAIRALALSHLITYSDGRSPGPEGSLDKLGWSELFQQICRFALQVVGPEGLLAGDGAPSGGYFVYQYLYSRGRTIAAGTSEIQRNIIADRILGLRE